MVTLTRRRVASFGALSAGVLAVPRLLPGATTQARHPVLTEGTTLESTVVVGAGSGYRRLRAGPGQPPVLRTDLADVGARRRVEPVAVACVVQVSDLHVTDAQCPLRFEYLDRHCSTGHRPQELLGTHGAAALVSRINALTAGPFTGRAVDAVMTTGDNTDNQSTLELDWLLTVLAGGTVHPSSGDPDTFEGVGSCDLPEYWQVEHETGDRYQAHGFPVLPGLLAAATDPFTSPGLRVPWLLTMGNHDLAALGTLGPDDALTAWSVGDRKVFSASGEDALLLAARLRARTAQEVAGAHDLGPLLDRIAARGGVRRVTLDPRRAPFSMAQYVAALREPRFTGAGPVGHGYGPDEEGSQLYYATRLAPGMLAISLDTTNQSGGADGSLGEAQLRWLEEQLGAHRDLDVVVFSHHPSDRMTNLAPDPRDPAEPRHDGDAVARLLHRHPQVLAWVNGHCHHNRITPHRHTDPRRSFWEINTASHVDAPQQARVIEVARNGDGTVSLFTTMIDADAPLRAPYDDLGPAALASLYRELAFNDLTYVERGGRPADGNAELLLTDPRA